jgi:hypothetical protein
VLLLAIKSFGRNDLLRHVLAAISFGLATQSMMWSWITLPVSLPAGAEAELFFIHSDGSPMTILHELDPDLLRHGSLRDPMERRRMSLSPPHPSRAASLLFSLRALSWVSARAEIIPWQLTHESGHPAAIARDTGYVSKSVQHILNQKENAGHLRSCKEGATRCFESRLPNGTSSSLGS